MESSKLPQSEKQWELSTDIPKTDGKKKKEKKKTEKQGKYKSRMSLKTSEETASSLLISS